MFYLYAAVMDIIISQPLSVVVSKGDNVVFTCRTSKQYNITVTWTKNGLSLLKDKLDLKSPRYKVDDDNTLTIYNVSQEIDAGYYYCVAWNDMMKAESYPRAQLVIEGKLYHSVKDY